MFLAAENASIPGGKVGGVADVVQNLPRALDANGWRATVLIPSYGSFHKLAGAQTVGFIDFIFRGQNETAGVYELTDSKSGVRNVIVDHPGLAPTDPGTVYHEDFDNKPYKTDANKFAMFSAIAASWILSMDDAPDVVHLHDWHAAFYLLLREYSAQSSKLKNIRTVFTIHNLAYQGTRPLSGDESSLEAWFPNLDVQVSDVVDPEYDDCMNPMAFAIRKADCVSTVSPTYADEICEPSKPAQGFFGGEGLEDELSQARAAGRLVGILNGCDYDYTKGRRPAWQRILGAAEAQLDAWPSSDYVDVARENLASLPKRRPKTVLTSIGRLVAQKASLFFEELDDGRSAIETILTLQPSGLVLLLIGSGEAVFEKRMLEVARQHSNLLFLRGYSESLAEPVYRAGDLFLMPSSFEPCGISQMLAMRATQPCVVHGVGGLCDTVEHMQTGFVFEGETPAEQARQFVATVADAIALYNEHRDEWQEICIRAASQRFSWGKSARETIHTLYEHS